MKGYILAIGASVSTNHRKWSTTGLSINQGVDFLFLQRILDIQPPYCEGGTGDEHCAGGVRLFWNRADPAFHDDDIGILASDAEFVRICNQHDLCGADQHLAGGAAEYGPHHH